jgi:hypothetical protein
MMVCFLLSLSPKLILFATGVGPGETKLKLKAVQDIVRHGMDNEAFSQAYIDEAIKELTDFRQIKTMGSRSSNTAAYADARATTASLTDEVQCEYLLFITPPTLH